MNKVVRIIGRMNGGGPSRQVAFLHRSLRRRYKTTLVIGSVEAGEQDMRYLLPDSDGLVEISSMSRSVRLWSDVLSFFRIVRVLLRERPDIVHTHTAKAGVLGRVAALLLGIPVRVHTYHGTVFHGYFGPTATRMIIAAERLLNRVTTRVIALSESQAEDLAEVYKVARREQISIVRNGFELERLRDVASCRPAVRKALGFTEREFLVLWAGRMVPIKNIELLLEVAARAVKLSRIQFLIAGDGPLKTKIETAAVALPNLKIVAWQQDMKPLLAAADTVLLTSKNEGTPALLIEAMAAEKPFVSTAVGGVVDLASSPVQNVATGCAMADNCFLTSSDPGVIVSCVEQLASSPDLAARMGAAGRKFALANYRRERLAEEISELYQSLLNACSADQRKLLTSNFREDFS
jgi:glycosyltransferase involved in cell wall biosynthesis